MNWGKWIVLSFIFFAGFIITLVVVCMKQDVSLVNANYYQDELAYQDQIDRMENTKQLHAEPEITLAGDTLQIKFNQNYAIENGTLQLFCPSDPFYDRSVKLENGHRKEWRFLLDNEKKGLYRARLKWKMNGREFYWEEMVVL